MPTRAKGKRYPIEMSAVVWMDLLGYGSMLREVNFDPSHKMSQAAVGRLRDFQRLASKHTSKHISAMIVNDGVAYVRELTPRSHSVTYDFLKRTFSAFREIKRFDVGNGNPGLRAIAAVGPMLRIGKVIRPRIGHQESILKRFHNGRISTEQAVKEAFKSLPMTGSTPQLQANFAFTKAYLADNSGSRAGFSGSNFFIDANFFCDTPPSWIFSDITIDWEQPGMRSTFFRLVDIDIEKANLCRQAGILNAIEIAEKMSIDY